MNRTLPLDVLRTFLAIVDRGTFAAAASSVGRTVPAVSLQISRLEDQLGQALFAKAGRRMVLTAVGRDMVDYARTLLAANDAAIAALSKDRLSGTVRFGVLHDALEAAVARVLADFSTMHPGAKLSIMVDTSQALVQAMEAGALDQCIAFEVATRLPNDLIGLMPMRWIGIRGALLSARRPLPLVLLDEPCAFRKAALTALDRARISYQIVLVSQSLAAVRAAVDVGLGITARTDHFLETLGSRAMQLTDLPTLPEKQLRLYRAVDQMTSRTGSALRALCLERLATAPEGAVRARGHRDAKAATKNRKKY